MSKKKKVVIAAVFLGILVLIGAVAGVLNYQKTQAGTKEFQVEVISERDEYSEVMNEKSDKEYLGEFLREYELCAWEESTYGIYIKGFDGMMEDMDNQYWWCVTVNGESPATGADGIVLEDGSTYTFTLMQGW